MKKAKNLSLKLSGVILGTQTVFGTVLPAFSSTGNAEDIGFPQLNPESYASQIFWLAIAFVVMYVLMSKIALPRVGAVIDTRQQKQDGDLSRAETANDDAEKITVVYEEGLTKAHNQAQDVLASTEVDISEQRAEAYNQFGIVARERILEAEQRIIEAKKNALDELINVSAEIAAEITNKVAAIKIDKATAQKAVTTVMNEG